jgi:hypothetical protein
MATKERLLHALRSNADAKTAVAVDAVRTALRPGASTEDEANAPLTETEKQLLELAMRIIMEELLAKSKEPGVSIEAAGLPRHLDLAIELAAAEASDPNTPFALLEDLFDANVISAAESLFALVEARAAALAPFLTADAKYQRCKLTLIRSCNELLRRLSKSKNTNFRGRVLMFMAYTFPLGERSGVNLKGATAPSSVEVEPDGGVDDDDMQVDAGAPGAAESASGPAKGVVNYGFYATFWGLQQAFAEPAKSVGKDAWPGLVERLQTVLEVSIRTSVHAEPTLVASYWRCILPAAFSHSHRRGAPAGESSHPFHAAKSVPLQHGFHLPFRCSACIGVWLLLRERRRLRRAITKR